MTTASRPSSNARRIPSQQIMNEATERDARVKRETDPLNRPSERVRSRDIMDLVFPTDAVENDSKKSASSASTMNVHEICPNCDSSVRIIKCKTICPNCRHIIQSCCD